MEQKEKKEINQILLEMEPEERKVFFSPDVENKAEWIKRFLIFCRFYFAPPDSYPFADFHKIYAGNIWDIIHKKHGHLYMMNLSAREQAKTAIARCAIVYLAVYELETFIGWLGADGKKNIEEVSAIREYMLSDMIKLDFGDFTPRRKEKDLDTQREILFGHDDPKKRMFLYSFTPTTFNRGRTQRYTNQRLSVMFADDVETSQTLNEPTETEKVIDLYKGTILQTLDQRRRIVMYNANYLSTFGLTEMVKRSTPEENTSIVPLINGKGEIMWPEKYCWTEVEAEQTGKISIEAIKAHCLAMEEEGEGSHIWEREHMCDPTSSEKLYHDMMMIKAFSDFKEPIKEIAGIHVYMEYKPEYRLVAGVDTSTGSGKDGNAIAIIAADIYGAREYASFNSNRIKQHDLANMFLTFAAQHKNQIFLVGDGNFGLAFNQIIRDAVNEGKYPDEMVYRNDPYRETGAASKGTPKDGFVTTQANKEMVATSFKAAIERGHLVLHSKPMYKLLSQYTHDIHEKNRRISTGTIQGFGAHCDLLDAHRYAYFGLKHPFTAPKQTPSLRPQTQSTVDAIMSQFGG